MLGMRGERLERGQAASIANGAARPAAFVRIVVPLEKMQRQHAQGALEPMILLLAHAVDLLGDCGGIDFGEFSCAQLRLAPSPG
jgi:hypothetical protein